MWVSLSNKHVCVCVCVCVSYIMLATLNLAVMGTFDIIWGKFVHSLAFYGLQVKYD
jgi:hypothetical protein